MLSHCDKSVRALTLMLALVLAGCGPREAEVTPTPEVAPGPTTGDLPPLMAEEGPSQMEPLPIETEGTTFVADMENPVVERYRIEYEDPERLHLDIAIPRVVENVLGATEINAQIETDYAYFIDRPPQEYREWDLEFSHPLVQIKYGLYQWEGLYELCIWGQEWALEGSGPLLWTSVYSWDPQDGTILSLEELLDRFDYTTQDVERIFREKMVEPEDVGVYTWGDIQKGWFYIDEAGELAFTVSLYA